MFHTKLRSMRLGLIIATLFCTSPLYASPQTTPVSHKASNVVKTSEKKTKKNLTKKPVKHQVKSSSAKKTTRNHSAKTASRRTKATSGAASCSATPGRKNACKLRTAGKSLNEPHKQRVKAAQKTAINKLMGQLGKPYRFGGSSPVTGFDCSGLVYYAYKDLVNFKIPRTANEMYHLRDAAEVDLGELESGDLVFFRTQGRGVADHVGVYVGNGKFIQSPSTGKDIQITSLRENYWKRHYVGAKRVMTPRTVR